MRKPRLTWEGAYHHVMNKGINNLAIFNKGKFKRKFCSLISEFSKKYFITIFAYCLMDNHYHLILQNSSGMLSRFMQALNGSYGTYYRQITQSKGYVYQSRYKSTLIENDSYLLNSIVYTLNNPSRSKLVSNPLDYPWSSVHSYFRNLKTSFIDYKYVNGLFQNQDNFYSLLQVKMDQSIEISHTPYGDIFGSDNMVLSITQNNKKSYTAQEKNKIEGFQAIEKTIREFECEFDIKLKNINTKTIIGKKIRRKLLRLLRDKSLVEYSEIAKLSVFSDVKENSLRNMYKKSKSE